MKFRIFNSAYLNLLILLFLLPSCNAPCQLIVKVDDKAINNLYLYRDIYCTISIDSSRRSDNQFLFKTNLFKEDLYFIADKTPKESKIPKYFGQLIISPLENDTMVLLPELKYEITGSKNLELKNIYEDIFKILPDSFNSYMKYEIKKHANDPISPFLLYYLNSGRTIEGSKFLDYKNLIQPQIIEKTYYGGVIVKVSETLLRNKLPENIELKDKYGEKKTMTELVNKITFIDNWASWCAPCIKEIPEIIKVYEGLKNKDAIRFLAFSQDESESNWINAMNKINLPFESYILSSKENYKRYTEYYGIQSIPYGLLLDKEGAIIKSGINNAVNLKAELEKLYIR